MVDVNIRNNLRIYSPEPFEWGTMDCMQFVSKVLGIEHSYQYSTEDEAIRLMQEHGGMIGFVSHILKQPPSENFGVGDPVVVNIWAKDFCGIEMVDSVVVKSEVGVIEIPKKFIIAGWHCA